MSFRRFEPHAPNYAMQRMCSGRHGLCWRISRAALRTSLIFVSLGVIPRILAIFHVVLMTTDQKIELLKAAAQSITALMVAVIGLRAAKSTTAKTETQQAGTTKKSNRAAKAFSVLILIGVLYNLWIFISVSYDTRPLDRQAVGNLCSSAGSIFFFILFWLISHIQDMLWEAINRVTEIQLRTIEAITRSHDS